LMQDKTLHIRAQKGQYGVVRRQHFGPNGHFHKQPHGHTHRHSHGPYFNETRGEFVHPAMCDSCNQHIVGLRHKCNECPDFDLCNVCIEQAPSVHPEHTFTKMERSYRRWHHDHKRPVVDQAETKQTVVEERIAPGPRCFGRRGHFVRAQKNPEEFRHPAVCDKCNAGIVGIRHKCKDCPDYDLCKSCFVNVSEVHPGHEFTSMERTPRCHGHSRCHQRLAQEQRKDKTEVEDVVEESPVVEAPVEERVVETPAEEAPVVEAPVVEEPAVETPANNFTTGLRYLNAMGFDDVEKNIRALVENRGDVSLALSQLLE